ncbi:SPON1 protein, partial [Pachycephala philippinensis]|nr:SPON1 protein [Pachycephala philippinensis]
TAPSSCLVTEWGEWDECSASCGTGMKRRHRMIKMTPADGSMCKAETTEAEKCMMPECPIDCELTEWSQWSECNTSCGKGHMIRTRMIKIEPQFGGTACPETVQRTKCRVRKCLRGPGMEKRRWKEAR